MSEEEKKKKKGMAIVIAVTPHAPKKPEDTSKPDEKMEKAWAMMKDSARYRPELDEKIPEKYRRYAPEGAFPAKDVMHDTDMMEHPDWHEDLTEDELFELAEKLQNDPHDADAWMGDESPEHFERMKELGFPKGGGPTSPFLDDEPEEEDDPMEPWMEDEEKLKSWPMKKAWLVLKNANIANILADQEEGRDFARQIAGKPTQGDYQDLLSHILQGYDDDDDYGRPGESLESFADGSGPTKPSEIPVEDPMDDVREEEEREEKLAEGVDPEEYRLRDDDDRVDEPYDHKYDEEPTNPFKR
tara:strand:+ start:72 stop:971 length:900 start_codon:yes stop_codon:yes gene_type:complete